MQLARSQLSRRLVLVALLFASLSGPVGAQGLQFNPASLRSAISEAISTSGSFSIAPINNWGSGDFSALTDSFFGYDTPRVNQFSVVMDQTATTTYEGDLFFKKLKLKIGLDIDVDSNFVGKLERLMGYLNYDIFALRVETSTLKGRAYWLGTAYGGMPAQVSFDNPFVGVDLLYYLAGSGGIDYLGIGYSSYRLPVQLDCLVYDTGRQSVWWAPVVSFYEPDMAFQVYSALFGIDTLYEAMAGKGIFARSQGLGLWMWTQDRAGAGIAKIGPEAQLWIEAANGLPLWSATQITMLVDYNLTLGLQWVGGIGRLRVGLGLGYNIGGQTLTCITPKGPVQTGYVDASPSVYLFHFGPVFKATISL